ncbi:hypothetical protein IGI96_003616 [Enterococcus sp. DIV0421]|uniref:LysR substrate-binding domain-containing protein n=1 Tax=Enterococcus sp. DIV0421 TaxID=2774688 RepID=UPI003F22CD0F
MENIKHLRYFISIVENDFNLKKTAEKLYLSQPALSIMITEYEKKQGIKLFNRKSNKLTSLTLTGKIFYQNAIEVLRSFDKLNENLHTCKKDIQGKITIGIPPLVLSIVFSTIMPNLILNNPNIQFYIKELGAYQLKSELLLNNIDIAILLDPEGIKKNIIDSYLIQESELAIFMSSQHKLSSRKKLYWEDLHNEKMAIFDETFMIHHLIKEKFKKHNIYQNIVLTSKSWDFLLNSTKINDEFITIVPYPLIEQYPLKNMIALPIHQPIPWRVMLTRIKKSNYTTIEEFIFDQLLNEFGAESK